MSAWVLAIVVQRLPVSVAYAAWTGLGTAAIAVIGVVYVLGVVVLNLRTAH